MRARRRSAGTLLATAFLAMAAPGYRHEVNPNDGYAVGTQLVVTGASIGGGNTAPFDVELYDAQGSQLFAHTLGFVQLGCIVILLRYL